jgi:peptide/nickel transport system permease protein
MASSTHVSRSVDPGRGLPAGVKETSLSRRRLNAFWASPASRLGLVALLFILFLALLPAELMPYNPTRVNLAVANRPGAWVGDWEYPLGTDFLGRDMVSRAIHATRLTLVISGSAVLMASGWTK